MARPSAEIQSTRRSIAARPAIEPLGSLEADQDLSSDTASDGASDSFVDTLGRYLGPVPWWIVSTLFHLILFVLMVLLMTDVPRDTTIVTIQGSPVEQIEPPKDEPEKKIDVVQNERVIEFNTDEVPVVDAVVPMENITDVTHNETDDQMEESNTARGDLKNIGTVNLGGYGAVGVMGVGGGGGGGAYGTRTGGGRHKAAIRGGGSKASEGAVDWALEWLAKHQSAAGYWDTMKYEARQDGKCDTAATGMALLAFLGAGHSDKRGQYKDNVKRGIDWLIQQQKADGCIYPGANGQETSYGTGYFHAIGGLALAECFGMGRSPEIKAAAQKAIDYSVNTHQNGEGSDKTGWRYTPKGGSDISVSGWFIMQLKSARLAGLIVPQEAFQGAVNFLDSVQVKGDPNDPYSQHRYKYTADQPEPSPMTTMIGCTARMFLGWPKEELAPAVTWAADRAGYPAWGDNGAKVDWYYWYYGTMTTFQMGGDVWKKWNEAMRDMLVDRQRKDGDEKGSWDPTGNYQNLGRVWSTACGALCLEVYYRYSPLYGDGKRGAH